MASKKIEELKNIYDRLLDYDLPEEVMEGFKNHIISSEENEEFENQQGKGK